MKEKCAEFNAEKIKSNIFSRFMTDILHNNTRCKIFIINKNKTVLRISVILCKYIITLKYLNV